VEGDNMKKLFPILFLITTVLCFGIEIRSNEINDKFKDSIEKVGELLIVKFKFEHFEKKDLDIGFHSLEYEEDEDENEEINEKITDYLKEYLTLNGKDLELNIINEDYDEITEVLAKERDEKYEDVRLFGDLKKTKYLITVKTNDFEYSNNFYLKEELEFDLTVELTNVATGEVMITKTENFDFAQKIEKIYVIIISVIMFLIGIFISFLTHKYYTLKIMFYDIILITILNLYYYMI
jgi:hypothetical protein